MTLSLAETVQLRRAEEQAAAVVRLGTWERDSWDVPVYWRPTPAPKRATCIECGKTTRGGSIYCRLHYGRMRRYGCVDSLRGGCGE